MPYLPRPRVTLPVKLVILISSHNSPPTSAMSREHVTPSEMPCPALKSTLCPTARHSTSKRLHKLNGTIQNFYLLRTSRPSSFRMYRCLSRPALYFATFPQPTLVRTFRLRTVAVCLTASTRYHTQVSVLPNTSSETVSCGRVSTKMFESGPVPVPSAKQRKFTATSQLHLVHFSPQTPALITCILTSWDHCHHPTVFGICLQLSIALLVG